MKPRRLDTPEHAAYRQEILAYGTAAEEDTSALAELVLDLEDELEGYKQLVRDRFEDAG